MARRLVRLPNAVVIVAAVALLAGCRRGPAAAEVAGMLTEDACPAAAEAPARCARLSVFENRAKKSGRLIPLRIVVLRATGGNPAPDPVFFLAGGPGQAATELI